MAMLTAQTEGPSPDRREDAVASKERRCAAWERQAVLMLSEAISQCREEWRRMCADLVRASESRLKEVSRHRRLMAEAERLMDELGEEVAEEKEQVASLKTVANDPVGGDEVAAEELRRATETKSLAVQLAALEGQAVAHAGGICEAQEVHQKCRENLRLMDAEESAIRTESARLRGEVAAVEAEIARCGWWAANASAVSRRMKEIRGDLAGEVRLGMDLESRKDALRSKRAALADENNSLRGVVGVLSASLPSREEANVSLEAAIKRRSAAAQLLRAQECRSEEVTMAEATLAALMARDPELAKLLNTHPLRGVKHLT